MFVITKLELGGAQTQLLALVKGLDKKRYNLFLFTACNGLLLNDARDMEGLTLRESRFLDRPINLLKDFLVLGEIRRFIRDNNIHIVHTHSSKTGILGRWAAKLEKVRIVVHTVHGWSFNDYQSIWKRAIFKALERKAAENTNRIIVVSKHDKEKGIKYKIGSEDKYRIGFERIQG